MSELKIDDLSFLACSADGSTINYQSSPGETIRSIVAAHGDDWTESLGGDVAVWHQGRLVAAITLGGGGEQKVEYLGQAKAVPSVRSSGMVYGRPDPVGTVVTSVRVIEDTPESIRAEHARLSGLDTSGYSDEQKRRHDRDLNAAAFKMVGIIGSDQPPIRVEYKRKTPGLAAWAALEDRPKGLGRNKVYNLGLPGSIV